MKKYEDFKFIDFPKEIHIPLYYLFLTDDTKCIKSNEGFILFVGANHYINSFPIGEIDKEDLNLNVPLKIWYLSENKKVPNDCMDFLINYSDKEIHKYKQKNSTDRKIKDLNLKIYHNENNIFESNDFDELFEKWKKQTKSENPINHKDYLNFKNCEKITYKINDSLVGIQIFKKIGTELYWLLNMIDYSYLSSSGISWIYPIEYFNCKIHYLGARNNDDRLIEHKMRMCKGNYITFENIVIPTTKQCSETTRQKRLSLLDNLF